METLKLQISPSYVSTYHPKIQRCGVGPRQKQDPVRVYTIFKIKFTRKFTTITDDIKFASKSDNTTSNKIIKQEKYGDKIFYTYESNFTFERSITYEELKVKPINIVIKEIENENQHFTLIFNEASISFQTIIVNPVPFKFYNYIATFQKGEESLSRRMIGSFDSNFDTIVESTTNIDEVERLSKIIGRITASLMLSTSPDTSS